MHEEKEVKRIGIYHSKDMDGYCSGAIMKLRYPGITLVGYDYGEDIWEKLIEAGFDVTTLGASATPFDKGDLEVIMADVSLEPDEMMKLSEWCGGRFTWIDHHKSAIEKMLGSDFQDLMLRGGFMPVVEYVLTDKAKPEAFICDIDKIGRVVLRVGRAACELCWDYLMAPSMITEYKGTKFEKVPEIVQYLGEYDTWRNEDKKHWNETIMPFQYGMRLACTGVEDFPMYLLTPSEVFNPMIGPDPIRAACEKIRQAGKTILQYQNQQNVRACRSAFEVEFEGLRAICLNSGGANSQLFDSVWDEKKYDIMMPFVFTGKQWTFSIYTTKPDIDCSELAKKHGGGGHKQAAGFQCGTWDTLDCGEKEKMNEKRLLLIDKDSKF